jgi:hypothetical protein
MTGPELRTADFARHLLRALEASEGRRKKRARDTKPDEIGLDLKRRLLEAAVLEDPPPDEFEKWLLDQCLRSGQPSGPTRAMAQSILEEWTLARQAPTFRDWLERGAPSADA